MGEVYSSGVSAQRLEAEADRLVGILRNALVGGIQEEERGDLVSLRERLLTLSAVIDSFVDVDWHDY